MHAQQGSKTDEEIVRGGLDSLAWVLNNASKHGTPKWEAYMAAARDDREAALAALGRMTAEVTRANLAIQGWMQAGKISVNDVRRDYLGLPEHPEYRNRA
jgi:hypothetical protein